jgi:exosortase K
MKKSELRNILAENVPYYGVGLLLACTLKAHYSRATADQLLWVLCPTARLVDLIAGIGFEREPHAGLMSREHGIILAPACAGVNFMIIAFSTLWFSFAHRLEGWKYKIFWLWMSVVSAYLLTLGVNGFRIIISVYLNRADIYGGWLTPERAHRLEGMLIYLFFLVVIHRVGWMFVCRLGEPVLTRVAGAGGVERGPRPMIPVLVAPLFWYVLVTVGAPFLNQGWKGEGARFMEHSFLVAAVCSMVVLLMFFSASAWRRWLSPRVGTGQIRCGLLRKTG